jgi:hypothetical protein
MAESWARRVLAGVSRPRGLGGLLALCLGTIGCGDDSVAGKTNSSETGNVLTARIVDSLGAPVVQARVELVELDGWRDRLQRREPLASTVLSTDDSGRVVLVLAARSRYALVATSSRLGVVDTLDPAVARPVFQAHGLGQFLGHLAGGSFGGDEICLEGTGRCELVSGSGNYSIAGLPRGDFHPVLRRAASSAPAYLGTYTITPQFNPGRDTLFYRPDSLLLDDFEDGDRFGTIRSLFGSGQWWLFGQRATSIPATPEDIPGRIEGGGPGGKSLRISVTATDTSPVCLVGIDLGMGVETPDSQRVFVDVSQTTSIRFRVKGSGSMKVMIQSRRVLQLGDQLHLHAVVPLGGDWQDISVPTSTLRPFAASLAAQEGLTFSQASERVGSIFFQFEATGDYWLDDIRLVGPQTIRPMGWRD